jgi:hypothetical protein
MSTIDPIRMNSPVIISEVFRIVLLLPLNLYLAINFKMAIGLRKYNS